MLFRSRLGRPECEVHEGHEEQEFPRAAPNGEAHKGRAHPGGTPDLIMTKNPAESVEVRTYADPPCIREFAYVPQKSSPDGDQFLSSQSSARRSSQNPESFMTHKHFLGEKSNLGPWGTKIFTTMDGSQSRNRRRSRRKMVTHSCKDRKSTRLNSSHIQKSRMPSSA